MLPWNDEELRVGMFEGDNVVLLDFCLVVRRGGETNMKQIYIYIYTFSHNATCLFGGYLGIRAYNLYTTPM